MTDADDVLLLWHLLKPGVGASNTQGGGADVLDCDSLLTVEMEHDVNIYSFYQLKEIIICSKQVLYTIVLHKLPLL